MHGNSQEQNTSRYLDSGRAHGRYECSRQTRRNSENAHDRHDCRRQIWRQDQTGRHCPRSHSHNSQRDRHRNHRSQNRPAHSQASRRIQGPDPDSQEPDEMMWPIGRNTPACWLQYCSSLVRRRFKNRERNLAASIFHIFIATLLCVAVSEPRWFHISAPPPCDEEYLGIAVFFTAFEYKDWQSQTDDITPDVFSINGQHPTMMLPPGGISACVNPSIVSLLRAVIFFCLIAILSTMFAFYIDTFGVKSNSFKFIRRNAIVSILTVFYCVAIDGLCYWVSLRLAEFYLTFPNAKHLHHSTHIEVKFDISFYLVAAAAVLAVVASATNLLHQWPSYYSNNNCGRSASLNELRRRRPEFGDCMVYSDIEPLLDNEGVSVGAGSVEDVPPHGHFFLPQAPPYSPRSVDSDPPPPYSPL